jgi:hypothetical protein
MLHDKKLGNLDGVKEMRAVFLALVVLGGLSEIATAASISAVLKPSFVDSNSNPFPGKITTSNNSVTTDTYFGSIAPWTPPDFAIPLNTTQDVGSGKAVIRTDVRRQDGSPSGATTFFLTSYSEFYTPGGIALADTISVRNSAYWEFTVNGIYNWSIADQDPEHDGLTGNTRTFEFVKVNGNTETLVSANSFNSTGAGTVNPSGVNLSSGIYRLRYNHFDPVLKVLNTPSVNSINLDITFTFQSEDNNPVPEPTSVAVFGLLGLGGAVAKWRRKK